MNRVLSWSSLPCWWPVVRLVWGLNHYRDNAITYKAQRDKKAKELELANATHY
ncbi:hypothetical protein [Escherichia coli]|uniref:hypothetical protein n=1 Tax=Escherichia coli TaxID=562 RepID=UPI000B143B21|nr:hypothetical protein [Escherichia coli]